VFSFQEVSAAPSSHETGRVSTAVEKERRLRTSDQITPTFFDRHGRLGSIRQTAFSSAVLGCLARGHPRLSPVMAGPPGCSLGGPRTSLARPSTPFSRHWPGHGPGIHVILAEPGKDRMLETSPGIRIKIQFKPRLETRTAPEAVEMAEVSL